MEDKGKGKLGDDALTTISTANTVSRSTVESEDSSDDGSYAQTGREGSSSEGRRTGEEKYWLCRGGIVIKANPSAKNDSLPDDDFEVVGGMRRSSANDDEIIFTKFEINKYAALKKLPAEALEPVLIPTTPGIMLESRKTIGIQTTKRNQQSFTSQGLEKLWPPFLDALDNKKYKYLDGKPFQGFYLFYEDAKVAFVPGIYEDRMEEKDSFSLVGTWEFDGVNNEVKINYDKTLNTDEQEEQEDYAWERMVFLAVAGRENIEIDELGQYEQWQLEEFEAGLEEFEAELEELDRKGKVTEERNEDDEETKTDKPRQLTRLWLAEGGWVISVPEKNKLTGKYDSTFPDSDSEETKVIGKLKISPDDSSQFTFTPLSPFDTFPTIFLRNFPENAGVDFEDQEFIRLPLAFEKPILKAVGDNKTCDLPFKTTGGIFSTKTRPGCKELAEALEKPQNKNGMKGYYRFWGDGSFGFIPASFLGANENPADIDYTRFIVLGSFISNSDGSVGTYDVMLAPFKNQSNQSYTLEQPQVFADSPLALDSLINSQHKLVRLNLASILAEEEKQNDTSPGYQLLYGGYVLDVAQGEIIGKVEFSIVNHLREEKEKKITFTRFSEKQKKFYTQIKEQLTPRGKDIEEDKEDVLLPALFEKSIVSNQKRKSVVQTCACDFPGTVLNDRRYIEGFERFARKLDRPKYKEPVHGRYHFGEKGGVYFQMEQPFDSEKVRVGSWIFDESNNRVVIQYDDAKKAAAAAEEEESLEYPRSFKFDANTEGKKAINLVDEAYALDRVRWVAQFEHWDAEIKNEDTPKSNKLYLLRGGIIARGDDTVLGQLKIHPEKPDMLVFEKFDDQKAEHYKSLIVSGKAGDNYFSYKKPVPAVLAKKINVSLRRARAGADRPLEIKYKHVKEDFRSQFSFTKEHETLPGYVIIEDSVNKPEFAPPLKGCFRYYAGGHVAFAPQKAVGEEYRDTDFHVIGTWKFETMPPNAGHVRVTYGNHEITDIAALAKTPGIAYREIAEFYPAEVNASDERYLPPLSCHDEMQFRKLTVADKDKRYDYSLVRGGYVARELKDGVAPRDGEKPFEIIGMLDARVSNDKIVFTKIDENDAEEQRRKLAHEALYKADRSFMAPKPLPEDVGLTIQARLAADFPGAAFDKPLALSEKAKGKAIFMPEDSFIKAAREIDRALKNEEFIGEVRGVYRLDKDHALLFSPENIGRSGDKVYAVIGSWEYQLPTRGNDLTRPVINFHYDSLHADLDNEEMAELRDKERAPGYALFESTVRQPLGQPQRYVPEEKEIALLDEHHGIKTYWLVRGGYVVEKNHVGPNALEPTGFEYTVVGRVQCHAGELLFTEASAYDKLYEKRLRYDDSILQPLPLSREFAAEISKKFKEKAKSDAENLQPIEVSYPYRKELLPEPLGADMPHLPHEGIYAENTSSGRRNKAIGEALENSLEYADPHAVKGYYRFYHDGRVAFAPVPKNPPSAKKLFGGNVQVRDEDFAWIGEWQYTGNGYQIDYHNEKLPKGELPREKTEMLELMELRGFGEDHIAAKDKNEQQMQEEFDRLRQIHAPQVAAMYPKTEPDETFFGALKRQGWSVFFPDGQGESKPVYFTEPKNTPERQTYRYDQKRDVISLPPYFYREARSDTGKALQAQKLANIAALKYGREPVILYAENQIQADMLKIAYQKAYVNLQKENNPKVRPEDAPVTVLTNYQEFLHKTDPARPKQPVGNRVTRRKDKASSENTEEGDAVKPSVLPMKK